jgi:hypothetical protein
MSGDALLEAIRAVRQRKEQADQDMRLLLAYAREHVTPRPYRLADLAKAAGRSISGVRTAYTQADITHAARLTSGLRVRQLDAVITRLLADSARHALPTGRNDEPSPPITASCGCRWDPGPGSFNGSGPHCQTASCGQHRWPNEAPNSRRMTPEHHTAA